MAEEQRKRSSFTPLLGLLIAVVLGVVAWFAAPGVLNWLAGALPNFAGNELPLSTSRPVFTIIIMVLALVVFGLVAALVTPKDTRTAREANIEKEREAMRRQQKAERMRSRRR
jgi:hypothetical protein